jgi:uncharacterized protein YecE (DUF72 family)
MGIVRVGTCSWADKTMVKAWYPPEVTSAEARLRYYADRFDTVEVDSTFYALPELGTVERWVERTPDGFIFHVKAFGLMTEHSVDPRVLEEPLASMEHELTSYGRVTRPSGEMLEATFDAFLERIEPLRSVGKLGGILMQFPPYFRADDPASERRNLAYLERAAERLDGYRVLVEFRDPSWVSAQRRESTLDFLRHRGLAYVSVDAPQFPDRATMPPLAEATSDWAVVRMHGRNHDTWFARTKSAAERFDYLYSEEELGQWEAPIRRLADETEVTWVLFNNCRHDYAPRNAREMSEILADLLPEPPPEEAPRPGEQERLF